MNAAAANGDNGADAHEEITRLNSRIDELTGQRNQLLGELDDMRQQRNTALDAVTELQIENAALRRRIEELEGQTR